MPVIPITSSNIPTRISGVYSKPYMLHNTGAVTLYLGLDGSVNAIQRELTLTPGSTVNWDGKTELWAISAITGVQGEVELIYNANTSFTPAPSSVGINTPVLLGGQAVILADTSLANATFASIPIPTPEKYAGFMIHAGLNDSAKIYQGRDTVQFWIAPNQDNWQYDDSWAVSTRGVLQAIIPNHWFNDPNNSPFWDLNLYASIAAPNNLTTVNNLMVFGLVHPVKKFSEIVCAPNKYLYPAGVTVNQVVNVNNMIVMQVVVPASTHALIPLSSVRGPAEIAFMDVQTTAVNPVAVNLCEVFCYGYPLLSTNAQNMLDGFLTSLSGSNVRQHVRFYAPSDQIVLEVETPAATGATIYLNLSFSGMAE